METKNSTPTKEAVAVVVPALLDVRAVLTDSDQDALTKIKRNFPNSEFTHWDAHYGIRRAEYRMERLCKSGYLKKRVHADRSDGFLNIKVFYSLA